MKYLNDSEKLSLRKFLPDELEGHEAPDHHGNNGYICPACGSGTKRGERSTGGVSYFRSRTDGSYLWKCKACGVWGDIFQFVQLSHGIDKTAAFTYVRDKYFDKLMGEEVTEGHQQEVKPTPQAKPKQQVPPEPKSKHDPEQQQMQDYCRLFGRDYLCPVYPGTVGDRHLQKKRGLTRDTIMKYGLLYDSEPECRNSAGGIIDFGAIIIPFRDEEGNTIPYFIARYIGEKAKRANVRYKNPPKSEAGGLPIWNPSSLYVGEPCFIVEGIFDALSILQVGAEAVALNGIGNANKLVEALRKRPTKSKLIICLDNDGNEATEKSARELTEKLQAMGFDAICNNDICGSFKDPNEVLAADPAGFRAAVQAKIEALRAPKIDASAAP